MKKIAILIGNSRGLSGTSKDMIDFYQHLISMYGGAWKQEEIVSLIDIPVSLIKQILCDVKNNAYDYVIVFFTGHGGCHDGTIIEVNPQNEIIQESLLIGLAPKQINILDCCRVHIPGSVPIDEDHSTSSSQLINTVRQEYDELISNSAPQLVRLYSCHEGESSYVLGDDRGSVYTQMLFIAEKTLRQQYDIVHIHDCHELAAQYTKDSMKKINLIQNPEILPSKCLYSQELPISFNPKCLKLITI